MSTPLARGPNDGVRDDGRSAPLGSKAVAPDCRGEDFFALDASLRSLLDLYMDGPLREHMWPHLQRLGRLAGDRLDELAAQADRNPPTLQARDRFGRTIVIVSHDVKAIAAACDRVACLSRTLHSHTAPSGLTPGMNSATP